MAQRPTKPCTKTRFQNVRLLKDQTLGKGAYGSVYKAKCDHLLCAAKVIHEWLTQPVQADPHHEHRLVQSRFALECELLRDITHPNIVQYLGQYTDPDTGESVLLMELMDDSLRSFLENGSNEISYYVQVSITLDVATALTFLHCNKIVHRDLSSNNILLYEGHRAKLSDFGMAKVTHTRHLAISNTQCPGTQVYMPPEALDIKPIRYTEKGDVFSLGVNIIQILTKKFPAPGERLELIPIIDPQFPSGQAKKDVPEVRRRQNHISEINPADPLLKIALDCLKDKENERPAAHILCERLSYLKTSQDYTSRKTKHEREVLEMQDTIDVLRYENTDLRKDLRELRKAAAATNTTYRDAQQMITTQQQNTQQLREELATAQATIREKDETIATRTHAQKELEEGIENLHLLNQELHYTLVGYKHQQPQAKSDTIRLKSTPGAKAPCKMARETNPVVGGSVVYLRPGESRHIYSFDSTNDIWYTLPDSPVDNTTLAFVNGSPVLVGGRYVSMLLRLQCTGKHKKWIESFPSMFTKRSNTIAFCTESELIVAGGLQDGRMETLTTIEAMDTDTLQWSKIGSLPEPLSATSATICAGRLYISNGEDKVLTCSLYNIARPSGDHLSHTWSNIAHLPVTQSTLVTFKNRLLAVGGCDGDRKPTTSVNMYNPNENSWTVIGHMSTARQLCFAAALPDERLMIVGGFTSQWGRVSNSVEFVSVEY
ncbi:uncharacterized protein LOC135342294 [Halichondria panicea]|uniref:uncharacterized protein LOC135342294 n=1 Tax=Halichondria panicea TaxID=6063 RepID=UPI00312B4199